jgi:hypothetical protein
MPKKSGSGDPADLIRMAIERIDDQIGELTAQRSQLVTMVSGGVNGAVVRRRGRPPAAKAIAAPATRKKRKVSAATKAKLKAAAKARWARYRAEKKAA